MFYLEIMLITKHTKMKHSDVEFFASRSFEK